ncbi:arfaptin-2 isoform X1 [Falco biarmicus]|uniref:arfaptin-2 isoform X1 n=1 Tax=Falco peregrinus TaxID=8954 RepID=UPI000FFB80BF|nr:arfaptin-2 isoform X1 [Falco peregrinus]XP_027669257.2 arfaptin-2 isoform X1 [Falco cherrug]XP_037232055.1 arfaptin-2 isoform X1 [Falco rusticolus]XP_055558623.1 arfaptin-2 isoform X1 [Falco cherrug]XP_056184959.1 arfaptin-2 isoform X1 [Falco biarmicus]
MGWKEWGGNDWYGRWPSGSQLCLLISLHTHLLPLLSPAAILPAHSSFVLPIPAPMPVTPPHLLSPLSARHLPAPPFPGCLVQPHPPRGPSVSPSASAASRMANQGGASAGSGLHQPHPSPATGGEEVVRGIAVEKFDIVKKWGINTYKCTKQLISERFGRGSRTVDLELETQIELLRETKRKYECVLQLARALTNHFYSLVQTQHALGDAFADLSQKSPELQEEFGYNAETQKLLCKNGETLLGAVNFFVSSINTLVNKTMEDTLMTVKQYETARLEYDAYRTDLEELSMGPRDASTLCRLDAAQSQFQSHKDKYEKLRADVAIKLKFLEENKIKVMHKQLLLFHNAISAYFAGNQQQLEQTLKQFNIKLKTPGAEKPSWLEEQ